MPPTWLDRSKWMGGSRLNRTQLAFWGGLALAVALLLYLARARAHWPWFSVWVLLLLATFAALSLPATRRALNLSWFGVTLITLSGVCLSNLFLVYVERHRQRSERLELRGAYLEPKENPILVGVGSPGLDVYLEHDPWELDHWSLAVRPGPDDDFLVADARNVEMIRVRGGPPWPWPVRPRRSVIGTELGAGRALPLVNDGRVTLQVMDGDSLDWNGSRAPLTLESALLNRRLRRDLRRGLPLAELEWDSLPDRRVAEDLVITETRPPRRLGRRTLSPARYRIVSRGAPDLGPDGIRLASGDTVWVTSRGTS